MKKILIGLFVLGSLSALGQHHYFNVRLGSSRQVIVDPFQSSLFHRGWEATLNLGYEWRREAFRLRAELGGQGGLLNPTPVANNLLSVGGNAHISFLWNLGGFGEERVYAGFATAGGFYLRNRSDFSNNATSYDGIYALGPQFGIERRLQFWNQKWRAGAEIFLPLLVVAQRPSYSRSFPDGDLGKPEAFLPGEAVLFRSKLYLDWMRDNGNIIRLSYGWEYRSLKDPNPFWAAQHYLGIETYFHL